jgi:hypothetical protein
MLIGSQTSGQGVVVMINANQPVLMAEIQQAVAFEYGWPGVTAHVAQPITAQALATALGRYRVNSGPFALVTREGERLFLALGGLPRRELLAVGDNRYLQREQEDARSFGTDAQGRAALILSNPRGQSLTQPRLADGDLARANSCCPAGTRLRWPPTGHCATPKTRPLKSANSTPAAWTWSTSTSSTPAWRCSNSIPCFTPLPPIPGTAWVLPRRRAGTNHWRVRVTDTRCALTRVLPRPQRPKFVWLSERKEDDGAACLSPPLLQG